MREADLPPRRLEYPQLDDASRVLLPDAPRTLAVGVALRRAGVLPKRRVQQRQLNPIGRTAFDSVHAGKILGSTLSVEEYVPRGMDQAPAPLAEDPHARGFSLVFGPSADPLLAPEPPVHEAV